MYLVIHPVICDNCINFLQIMYKFKSQCLKIEENILKFAEAVGQSRINLLDYSKNKITWNGPKNNNNYKGMSNLWI